MARKRKKRKQNPIIGIFCEGESEKQYFTMLMQKYRRRNVKIKIVAADLSGKSLIDKTIGKIKQEAKDFDQVYVVFDRDEHKKQELLECERLAKKNGIKIMFSPIDFEIWILLHFEEVLRSYNRKELVKKLSQEGYFNCDYNDFKGKSYSEYIEDKVQDAVDNATKLYKKKNNWIEDDPFTNIQIYLPEIFDRNDF